MQGCEECPHLGERESPLCLRLLFEQKKLLEEDEPAPVSAAALFVALLRTQMSRTPEESSLKPIFNNRSSQAVFLE